MSFPRAETGTGAAPEEGKGREGGRSQQGTGGRAARGRAASGKPSALRDLLQQGVLPQEGSLLPLPSNHRTAARAVPVPRPLGLCPADWPHRRETAALRQRGLGRARSRGTDSEQQITIKV